MALLRPLARCRASPFDSSCRSPGARWPCFGLSRVAARHHLTRLAARPAPDGLLRPLARCGASTIAFLRYPSRGPSAPAARPALRRVNVCPALRLSRRPEALRPPSARPGTYGRAQANGADQYVSALLCPCSTQPVSGAAFGGPSSGDAAPTGITRGNCRALSTPRPPRPRETPTGRAWPRPATFAAGRAFVRIRGRRTSIRRPLVMCQPPLAPLLPKPQQHHADEPQPRPAGERLGRRLRRIPFARDSPSRAGPGVVHFLRFRRTIPPSPSANSANEPGSGIFSPPPGVSEMCLFLLIGKPW